MEPSKDQIGYKDENGKRVEPTKCAVSGRDCQGKPHITHYGPDEKFVYVLAEYDHMWNEVAPYYGFPVAEDNTQTQQSIDFRKLVKAKPEAAPASQEDFAAQHLGLGSLRPVPGTSKRPKPPTLPTDSDKTEGEA